MSELDRGLAGAGTALHLPPSEQAASPARPHDVKEAVIRSWCRVLGVDAIGPSDNFFDLGGTSLAAMELSTVIYEALNVEVDARTVFANPALGAFVQAVTPLLDGRRRQLHQVLPEGESWPLLPGHAWFFGKQFAHPERYCVAVIFQAVDALDVTVLHRAIALALDHHDALRTQFRPAATGWEQFEIRADDGPSIDHHDLSRFTRDDQDSRIRAIGEAMALGFTFGEERLVRVATIDLGPERGIRLLLVAHHLIADFMSWRILMEDIETAYRWFQSTGRSELGRPPLMRTTTAKAWSMWLNGPEAAADAARDADYWRRPRTVVPLPLEAPEGRPRRQEVVRWPMSERLTTAVVRSARRHHTNIDVLLLAAFGRAIADWCGTSQLVIGLNSHGRSPVPPGINLSRTVGWLARQAPIYLDMPTAGQPSSMVDAAVAALDEWPRDGLGYNTLRFAPNPTDVLDFVSSHADAEVSFNYLGNSDAGYRSLALFREATEDTGVHYSPDNAPARPLGLLCGIKDKVVLTVWLFDAGVLSRSTVETLAGQLEDTLTRVSA